MMATLNVQIYFHRAGETASRLSSTIKKQAFLRGLLTDIPDVESFKKFILQYGLFDVVSVNGSTYTDTDGQTKTATFLPKVQQSELPTGEVYCGILISNGLPVDESNIHYLLIVKPDDLPDDDRQTSTMTKSDGQILNSIRVLIDLYGNVAETIIDKIGDKELRAIEILENYINQR
jgi:hypothetical protein